MYNEKELKTYHEELNTNTSKYEKYEARDDQHKRYVFQRVYHTLEHRLNENTNWSKEWHCVPLSYICVKKKWEVYLLQKENCR